MYPRKLILLIAALGLQSAAHALQPGQSAPSCLLKTIDGAPSQDLGQFRGKVMYVDFWASWCGPCAQSFPFMNALDRDYRARGLRVVGINLDEKSEDAREFLAQRPASFTVTAAGSQCPDDFGVMAMPSSYLIDRKGIIRHVHLGFRSGEAEELRGMVEQLLAEGPAGQ